MSNQDILKNMTLDDKIALCSGASFWQTKAFPQYGIPSLFMCDGPHGLRKQDGHGDHLGLNASVSTTCFPTASALASSWDVDLLQRVGEALGEEAVQEDVQIILGPGVNIKRNPLCGRNFEYFSEDPFLAGKLAAAWIHGVQSHSIGVSLKHFAANNQELKRMSTDALVDERALREIYLAAFEIAVRDAEPATVMCAYNKINGVYCSDNRRLLTDILRNEWGFKGLVMSDWGATNDRVKCFQAGMDLEMPSSMGCLDREVKSAIENGVLKESDIDTSVERLLDLAERTGHGEQKQADRDALYLRHHDLAREAAASSGILLKNTEDILPLCAGSPITVIGALAEKPRYQGTGSSQVTPTKLVNLLEGLSEYTDRVAYCSGYSLIDIPDEQLLDEATAAARAAECVVLCVGLTDIFESEGFDRETMHLPTNQLALIDAVAKAAKRVIVVMVGGSAVEMPWAESVQAILHMQLAGQAGGIATADLLFGAANPSGRLAETYPLCYEDVVNSSYYDKEPKQAEYMESLYVGYRYFDSAQQTVRFPFGFGLSYTTFEYSDLAVHGIGDQAYQGTVTVRNTGSVAGSEVVQLYVSAQLDGLYRPTQELKGFAKVYLQPGESKQVSLTLDRRAFAVYDATARDWVVEAGAYEIRIGSSSRDIRLIESVTISGTVPRKSMCSPWYKQPRGVPNKSDFITIYGKYPDCKQQRKGSYDMDSSIAEMQKDSWLCRFVFRSIEKTVAKMFGGKVDYANVQFKMLMTASGDNPLHAMRLFSPQNMTEQFLNLLLDTANGHTCRGIWRFVVGNLHSKAST